MLCYTKTVAIDEYASAKTDSSVFDATLTCDVAKLCHETRTLLNRLLLWPRAHEKGPDAEQRHSSAEDSKHSSRKHISVSLVARSHEHGQRSRDHQREQCFFLSFIASRHVAEQAGVRRKIVHGARTTAPPSEPFLPSVAEPMNPPKASSTE